MRFLLFNKGIIIMKSINKIQHDLENSTISIQCLTQAIQPAWSRVITYIEAQNITLISDRELDILKKSMKMLEEEANKLLVLFRSMKMSPVDKVKK